MWIKSHRELQNHPKTKRLARKLSISIPQTIGHLHCLWWWCVAYAPDGDISRYSADDIADAAMWDGCPEQFISSMIAAGLIDSDDGENHSSIHDWNEYQGWIVEKRKSNAEYMRRSREKHKALTREQVNTHDESSGEIVGTHSTPSGKNVGTHSIPTSERVGTLDKIRSDKIRQDNKNTLESGGDFDGDLEISGGSAEDEVPDKAKPRKRRGPQLNVTLEEVAEYWNSSLGPMGFSCVQTLNDTRKRKFKARVAEALEERNNIEWWRGMIDRFGASSFICQEAQRKAPWVSFDWLITNDQNLVKIAEGRYDNRGNPNEIDVGPYEAEYNELRATYTPLNPAGAKEGLQAYAKLRQSGKTFIELKHCLELYVARLTREQAQKYAVKLSTFFGDERAIWQDYIGNEAEEDRFLMESLKVAPNSQWRYGTPGEREYEEAYNKLDAELLELGFLGRLDFKGDIEAFRSKMTDQQYEMAMFLLQNKQAIIEGRIHVNSGGVWDGNGESPGCSG